jgi:hypothetical protein
LLNGPMARAQQAATSAQVRANDFPSVRGYDPGYPIPYDPKNPYVALEYINQQFDGVWTDIDGVNQNVRQYYSRAPMAEDYTDPNRPNPSPNTPHLTAAAAVVYRKTLAMTLAGANPSEASGWCFIDHSPTLGYWNQFMFTPDSMDASIPGGAGSIGVHVYMDGRTHPANLVQSETGHQIAHWEGATLVIDSVGFVGDRDLELGLLSSDQEHVVTRYRRLPPDLLEAEYTVTDPKVLAQPWTFKRRFRRTSGDITLSRDAMHCVANTNLPDSETGGGTQLTNPEGKKLQKVPKE